MKTAAFVLLAIFFHDNSAATGWKFLGPDSTQWRNIVQMDVSFQVGRLPYIGTGTTHGICMSSSGTWNYVLRDSYGSFSPPEDIMYRAVYFSPWNDSVAFVGFNVRSSGEPGSLGGRVPDIQLANWGFPWQIGGGYVGYSPSLSFECSPHHPNQGYSWIIDLYKSSDNGRSWQHQQNTESYGVLFLSFDLRRDSVLYVGRKLAGESNFGIYRSTDDGSTWTFVRPISLTSPSQSQRTAGLIANGDTLVLATNRFPSTADSSCGISVSTDRGISWSHVLRGVNVQRISRHPFASDIWFAAAQGGIYRSLNGGVSWQLYSDTLPSLNLVDITQDPYSDTLYVATSDSGVYKVFDVTVGVREEEQGPAGFRLHQNYPNPFNPVTTIRFEVGGSGFVTLKVFDLLGKEVATLVNEEMKPGSYENVFDGNALASGMYLYRMQTVGSMQTRKLLLVR